MPNMPIFMGSFHTEINWVPIGRKSGHKAPGIKQSIMRGINALFQFYIHFTDVD